MITFVTLVLCGLVTGYGLGFLENKIDQEAGNNRNAFAARARPVEKIKMFRLFLTLSNNTPLAKRRTFDINSVEPSKMPRIAKERPNESVTKKGIMVIPTVVEIANKKFIKKILPSFNAQE